MKYKRVVLNARLILLYAIIAGFLLSLTPLSLALLPHHKGEPNMELHLLDATIIFVLNVCMFFVSLWLNLRLLNTNLAQRILLNLLVYIGLSLLAIVIHSPFWEMLDKLPMAFFVRDEFVRNFIIFAISVIVAIAFGTFEQNLRMSNKILEIEKDSLSGQIESLKQQINPHFFFNILNTLSGLAQEDTPKTIEFIEKLSQVFRYVLDIKERNLVSVAEEIRFAEAYVFLMKVRFEDKFNLQFLIEEDCDALVPSLCIQLLLENCFKHNSMTTQKPINIEVKTENHYLTVKNTRSPMHTQSYSGIGLKNLNERCKLLQGREIEIIETQDSFIVKVPTC